jgi:hypothetical protein
MPEKDFKQLQTAILRGEIYCLIIRDRSTPKSITHQTFLYFVTTKQSSTMKLNIAIMFLSLLPTISGMGTSKEAGESIDGNSREFGPRHLQAAQAVVGLQLPAYPPISQQMQYVKDVKKIRWDAVKKDLMRLMTRDSTSSDWPADYGHYGPLFIRLAWHACGSYRTSDGRGGWYVYTLQQVYVRNSM